MKLETSGFSEMSGGMPKEIPIGIEATHSQLVEWSRNGRKIAMPTTPAQREGVFYVMNPETGEQMKVTGHESRRGGVEPVYLYYNDGKFVGVYSDGVPTGAEVPRWKKESPEA